MVLRGKGTGPLLGPLELDAEPGTRLDPVVVDVGGPGLGPMLLLLLVDMGPIMLLGGPE